LRLSRGTMGVFLKYWKLKLYFLNLRLVKSWGIILRFLLVDLVYYTQVERFGKENRSID